MTEIVAVPTAHRSELLALTLEKLAAANNLPEVHIYADSVPESRLGEIEFVRDLYLPKAFLFSARPHTPAPSGCWNILNAIKSAANFADDVLLVEEDVLVYRNFFDWHHTQTAPVSCGRKIPRFDLYTNPGTCFRRPLLDALMPHIQDDYFKDPTGYCERNFPPVHISCLDDGLIRRVLHVNQMEWVFPPQPVCAHIGFRNLDRIDIYKIGGETLEERIVRVRELVKNPPNWERYARDWEPFNPSKETL